MKRIMTSSSQSIAQTSTAQADTADSSTIMKRVWAFLLALVLCIGLMPSFAWAAEGDDESTDGEKTAKTESGNEEGEEEESDVSNPYNAEDESKLLNNLEARFIRGGEDAAISNDTVYAAIALDMLNKDSEIDKEAVLENLNNYLSEAGDSPSAGVLAKYVFALNAAGENCKAIDNNGETLDLVEEMEKLVDKDSMDIYSAVWVLGAYPYGNYNHGEYGMTDEELAEFVADNQSSDGLYGAEGYEDTQTTAQAVYALDLYYMSLVDKETETAMKVKDAADKAEKALLEYQNEDGGFKLSKDDSESNIDATANIATVLKINGYDVASLESSEDPANLATENGSSPIGYLTAMADDSLEGYTESGTSDEVMTSATVFMALAANTANVDLEEIESDLAESGTENTATAGSSLGTGSGGTATPASASTTPSSSGSGTTASSTPSSSNSNPSSGSTLAKTGDADTAGVAGIALVALCGALVCALVAARRMRTNRDSARH